MRLKKRLTLCIFKHLILCLKVEEHLRVEEIARELEAFLRLDVRLVALHPRSYGFTLSMHVGRFVFETASVA